MRYRKHFRGAAAQRHERVRKLDEAYLQFCRERGEPVDLSCIRAACYFEDDDGRAQRLLSAGLREGTAGAALHLPPDSGCMAETTIERRPRVGAPSWVGDAPVGDATSSALSPRRVARS